MNIENAIELLWQSTRAGESPPPSLHGKLTLEEAYRVQLGVLARRQQAGETLSGWKIGITSPLARSRFGISVPVSSYLRHQSRFRDGHDFRHRAMGKPMLEAELCFTLGARLSGAGVTRDEAAAAVSAVAPAFELVDMRLNMAADLPLGVADGIVHWGYVLGDAVSPYPPGLDAGEIIADVRRNESAFSRSVGKEVMDHPLDGIAWLARHLSEFGVALEAGQEILTGTFIAPTPIAAGDRWEASFSGVGSVAATFK